VTQIKSGDPGRAALTDLCRHLLAQGARADQLTHGGEIAGRQRAEGADQQQDRNGQEHHEAQHPQQLGHHQRRAERREGFGIERIGSGEHAKAVPRDQGEERDQQRQAQDVEQRAQPDRKMQV
jgi:hypothetical protein